MIPDDPAQRHRVIAQTFTDIARRTPADAWDNPAPVPDWRARDVIRHLVEWVPGFLADGGVTLDTAGPSADSDPVAAWEQHTATMQALLDAPTTATARFAHPRLPEMPLAQVLTNFYTADVFMHTWDLARATGTQVDLDPDLCRELYEGLSAMGDQLRQGGQFGAPVPVPDDADWQTKLIGFIGRDPHWHAPE